MDDLPRDVGALVVLEKPVSPLNLPPGVAPGKPPKRKERKQQQREQAEKEEAELLRQYEKGDDEDDTESISSSSEPSPSLVYPRPPSERKLVGLIGIPGVGEQPKLEPTPGFKKEKKSKADRQMVSDHLVSTKLFESDEEEKALKAIVDAQPIQTTAFVATKLEKEARKNWDVFYKRNAANFYKDRHYIQREFPEVGRVFKNPDGTIKRQRLFEAGCGCGNALFPLIDDNPHLDFLAADFSPRAVSFVQQRMQELKYSEERARAFVLDLVKDEIPPQVHGVDYITMLFVLSGIHPDNMVAVLKKLYNALTPGGYIWLRDYARYDMTQLRFGKGARIDRWLYARWDGTRTYFTDMEHMASLMEAAGFVVVSNHYIKKLVTNVKENKVMRRTWLQIKCQKPATATAPSSATPSTSASIPAEPV